MNFSTASKASGVTRVATTDDYQKISSVRQLFWGSLITFLSLVLGISLAVLQDKPLILVAAVLINIVLLLVWRNPVLGVYFLAAGAVTFETYKLHFPDSLTDQVPFFHNLDSLGGPALLPLSPAEILMFSTVAIMVLKRIAERQKPLELGPLFPAIGFFFMMVMFGFVHGVGGGGDLTTAVWEIRSSVYLFFTYLLAFNLIKDRSQVRKIIWILLIAVAIKGIIGTWRYVITLGGDLSLVEKVSRANSLMAHEESAFFVLFFALIAGFYLFRCGRRQRKFSMFLALPVLLAFLANQRRASTLALFFVMLVVLFMTYLLLQHRRKLIARIGVVALLVLPVYVVVFGNSSGIIAQPAIAFTSLYNPGEKDAASDQYRVMENENLKYNIQLNPLLGQGYGKPMVLFLPIPNLTSIFSFWDTIPHNTILWVWLRLGIVGFVAFWFLVGRSIIGAAQAARNMKDPYYQMIAIIGMASIVSWVLIGAVDQGIADFRSTIIIGTLLGLISHLSELQKNEGQEKAREETPPKPATAPQTLSQEIS